ncbi:respiratory selenite reductase catalytic subunit SrrA [Bacillus marinisedimentorum]|uniref:respiratory selenite reductase catalytic subunit SrrA n=1 Tax=Bacillus marinisedimentorum TaxID=1821260 RepID=UPI000873169B|nr:respiratory selenite reductase catalytic subunit SrrA [Bacillus marinisedimentorum]
MRKMKRRTFLKAAAVTAAAGSVPAYFKFADYQQAAAEAPVKKIPTFCHGCTSYCGIIATVKNDRLWKVEGHPVHLKSSGRICARGHGMASYLYSKDRVTGPMKRTGEGKFEPISWEQAYKEIGSKLKGIVSKYGGNSVVWMEHGTHRKAYVDRLFDSIGSPNFITQYSTCFNSKTNAWQQMTGTSLNGDHKHAKYMIFQGRNFAGGIVPNGMNHITKAKESGAKIVVIDPRYSEIAKLADEWIPIRPGTDLAFRLAMANVLIMENLYDKVYVKKYVDGFDEFKRLNLEYTPEWAASITGVKAEKIREIAREFAENAPQAFLEPGWHGLHAHYANSTQVAQMGIILNALVGNMYERGGLMPSAGIELGHLKLPELYMPEKGDRIDGAGVEGQYRSVEPSRGIAQIIPKLVEEGKAKAVFVCNYNPVRSAPDPEQQKKLKDAELVVSINIDWNETSYHTAHYILPEHYYLERLEHPYTVSGTISHDSPQVALRQPVVKPIHKTKDVLEMLKGISAEMGYQDLYPFTVEDDVKAAIEPLGITYDQLKKAGTIEFPATVKPGFPVKNGKPALPTKTGKIQFSADIFRLEGNRGIPTWIPPLVMPDEKKPDEFRLIHGKQPWHSHVMTNNNEYLMAMSERYNGAYMWMNTARAKKLGVKTGDTVLVKSSIAQKTVKVKVTELLHPDCVWIPSTYGGFSPKNKTAYGVGVNFNDFIPIMVEPYSGSSMSQEVVVSVRKEEK